MIEQRAMPYAALILRLTLSFFFFAHLIRKFVSVGFDKWLNGFIREGYPAWTLSYTVGIEFAGGAGTAVGAATDE